MYKVRVQVIILSSFFHPQKQGLVLCMHVFLMKAIQMTSTDL